MYIHIFIFQIKKQQWFHLSNTFWRDLISKNKKIKYIIKKVAINPCLFPSKLIIGYTNKIVKSILFIDAITKENKRFSFVFVSNLIVQKVIRTKAVLKTYIFQRGIKKYISKNRLLKTRLIKYNIIDKRANWK